MTDHTTPTLSRADALRANRLAAGLTQRAVATRAGVHPNTVARIERGELNSREPTWRAIEQAVTARLRRPVSAFQAAN